MKLSRMNANERIIKKRFTPEEKISIINEVTLKGQSIYSVCKNYKISKPTFYKWLRIYKRSKKNRVISFRSKVLSANRHPRGFNHELRRSILSLVHRHPEYSSHRIAKTLNVGNHGVQNLLVRKGLNKLEGRLEFSRSPFWRRESADRRLGMMELYKQGWRVGDICRHFGISKVTFAKWRKRYEQAQGESEALADRFVAGDSHHKSLDEDRKTRILEVVRINPQYSVHQIHRQLAGEVGHHGIQNLLAREGLNTYERRLAYVQSLPAGRQVKVAPTYVPTIPLYKWRMLFAPFKTVPKLFLASPLRALTLLAFSLSPFAVFILFLRLIFTSPSGTSPIGLVFAAVALTFGLFFFLYSLKYYGSVLMVLKLAQGGGGQTGDQSTANSLRTTAVDSSQNAVDKSNDLRPWTVVKKILSKLHIRLPKVEKPYKVNPLLLNLNEVELQGERPFVSIHVAMFNEKRVVERLIRACTSQEWNRDLRVDDGRLKVDFEDRGLNNSPSSTFHPQNPLSSFQLPSSIANYEVVIADDSTDETTEILKQYLVTGNWSLVREERSQDSELFVYQQSATSDQQLVLPTVKLIHRATRSGFKGGALQEALVNTDPRAEYVVVFDADFVPYPDTVEQFVKTFQVLGNDSDVGGDLSGETRNQAEQDTEPRGNIGLVQGKVPISSVNTIAAVQGYQWHVLNKSANWITRGVRTEYAGSYVIERSGEEIYQGLKQIAGSVYAIRADVLRTFGWGTSITEDFELTLRLYEAGYKVAFTPYIQAPAEAVSTIKRLIRQRMRWAEGASFNVKCMLPRIFKSPNMTASEKLEFLYLAPYYLQAAFFAVGTLSWFISEAILHAQLPFWTAAFGWSLVFTNLLALPLMNIVGLFLEESDERDYIGILSFIALSYIVVPFQAYAAMKGFIETQEGPWFRTPKTGLITDVIGRSTFSKLFGQLLGGRPVQAQMSSDALGNSSTSGESKPTPGVSLAVGVNLPRPAWSLVSAFNPPTLGTFGIRPRQVRWVGNMAITLTVIISLLINYASGFVLPAEAITPRIYSIDQAKSEKPQDTGYTGQELSKPTVFTFSSPKGNITQTFHKEPRVRVKFDNKELETVTTGSTGFGSVHHNSPQIDGRQITYPEIFDGVDLRYTARAGAVLEDYILKEYKPAQEINSLIRMVDVIPVEQNGVVTFVDEKTNEAVFTLPPPFMYEESSKVSGLEELINSDIKYSLGIAYEMHKTPIGWQLTKKLTEEGKKWLADPNRQFPVVVDPSVIVSGTIVDADVQFGGLQRKVAFVNGNWYAFHNDGADIFYKKSSDGVSWGSNVDVDTADADNYNASIWVKGNVIWVAWADDSADAIEFNSIDTASSDALGTKCTSSDLSAGTFDSTNMVSIAVQNTGTNIYVAQSDTDATPDSGVNVFQVTSACSFTDRTSGSGLTAGDRPVLVYDGDSTQRDDLVMLFQDGDLSYSQWDAITSVWVASNLSVDSANTDTTYSAISDGSTAWVLSQTSTTDTKFYRIGQFQTTIDTGVGGNRAFVDIDCPTSGDCKIVYFDPFVSTAGPSIMFVDCNNTSCSAPSTSNLDAEVGRGPAYGAPVAIDCPSATDCKVAYYSHSADDLFFRDCATANCGTNTSVTIDISVGDQMPSYVDIYCPSASECDMLYVESDVNDLKFVNCTAGSGVVCDTTSAPTPGTLTNSILDSDIGEMGGPASIYCPTNTDCKVVYYDSNTNGSILFADCNAAACSSATLDATSTIDSNVGVGDTRFDKVDCTAGATECRVAYYDGTDGDITFADCSADADCSPANCDTPTNCVDVDTDVGTVGSPVDMECNSNAGSPDDCKIFYYDGTDFDVTFIDCSNDTCSSSTISDIDTDVGADTTYLSLDCVSVSDCQLVYDDGTDRDLTLVDCEDGDCSAPTSTTDIDTTIEIEQPFVSMDCPADVTDCKIVFHDISEGDMTFVDCNDATCSAPTLSDIDTNVGRMGAPNSINCPAANDCKVVYFSFVAKALKFADCNDGDCDSPTISSLDTVNINAARSAIDCPTAADCKVVYDDLDEADITFLDCEDGDCSAPTTVRDLDTSVGGGFNGVDIDCSLGATDCRVVFFDNTDDDITYVDCSVAACCASNGCAGDTVTDVDTDTGTRQEDAQPNVDCVGGSTDCKIFYHDDVDGDVTFIDCDVAACTTPVVTDIDAAVGGDNLRFVVTLSMDCVAAANCKLTYFDKTDGTTYFVDCDSGDCSSNTKHPLTTVGGRVGGPIAMDCGTDDTDCKIVYSETDDSKVNFVDCLSGTCTEASLTVPFSTQTNVTSVSLTYDSTNDDIYAHIIQDETEQAYFKSTDASTISWSSQFTYSFTTGDLSQISAPMSGAGTTQIGVVLRQGNNYEFSAVPENPWAVLASGLIVIGLINFGKKYGKKRTKY